jgi:SAM-dependent methyltransferase
MRSLAGYGYRLTGIDNSRDMLRYARQNVPAATFLLADARSFHLPPQFHCALSTYDSLNHLLTPEDLRQAFQCVHASMLPGGDFLFDLNTEEAYTTQWDKSAAEVFDNSAYFIRGGYDPRQKLGSTRITAFRRTDAWIRVDLRLFQRYHPPSAVRAALRDAGFAGVTIYESGKDFEIPDNTGIGRLFFHARKSA